MRHLAVLAVGVMFLAPSAFAQFTGAQLESSPSTHSVQRFVGSLLRIAEVRKAFELNDTLEIHSGSGRWYGAVIGGVELREGVVQGGATHTLVVDPNAMMSIINAYDMPNTAKLAVKAQYMVARSDRAAVMTAIGAVARTPLDDRLPTTTPKVGDSIAFQLCSGTLAAYDEGRFVVTLCDERFTVNAIGGITSKLPPEHLGEGAGEALAEGAGESYGIDRTKWNECRAKAGEKPARGDYESFSDWADARHKHGNALAACNKILRGKAP